ncbi:MAG: hypothetical protein JWN30_701 [Bacilli bacterium]|nr:hypothetical protein [Bacilli bacterium]
MTKVLDLLFVTDQHKTVRIPIQNAIEPVDAAKVGAVLDQLVTSGVLQFKTGHVIQKSGAQLHDAQVTTVVSS